MKVRDKELIERRVEVAEKLGWGDPQHGTGRSFSGFLK
jgi:hypothetical protein